MSTIETTIADAVGGLPWAGTDGVTITSETRPAVRSLLCRLGMKGDKVMALDLDTLAAAYTSHAKYGEVATAAGAPVSTLESGHDIARAPYAPRNKDLLAYLQRSRSSRTVAPPPSVAPPISMSGSTVTQIWVDEVETLPPPRTVPDKSSIDTSKSAQLAALIAEIAGDKAGPLDEARVVELIKQHAPKPDVQEVRHTITIESREPQPARELPAVPRHAAFADVLAAVSAGLNVMLVGPAGAGKTHLCQQVAEALELSFRFTGALDSPYKLLGFTDAQGRTVRTPYRETYEHGGLFLFDEIDASAPGALLAFNAGLSNGHQDFLDLCVKRHDTGRFIASANTYGRGQDRVYVGRNQLDAASLDRFAVIAMDYDADLERALYGNSPWLQRVHKVRAAVQSLSIRHVVSMRAIEQGTKLLAAGLSQDRTEELALWKGLDAATVAKIKAGAL